MTPKLSGPMLPPASGRAPRQIFVLLHGYGSDGTDLIGLGRAWAPAFPDALFVSPNAPDVCDINPSGYQWFSLDLENPQNRVDGVKLARPVVETFLTDLWTQTGFSPSQTVLVGFSQGAMMALHVGLSLRKPVAGIVAFSGALVPPDPFPGLARPPIALIHGDRDGVLDPELSRDAHRRLVAAGYDAALHVSPGIPHSISPDGLDFATAFLNRVLPR